MSLDTLVNVAISLSATGPTKPGFGTPMVVGYHTRFVNRVQSYTSTKAMTDAGWAVTDPIYKAVAAIFSQNPRPTKVKVGRRAGAPAQLATLTVTDAVTSAVYAISVGSATYSYTYPGSGTTSTIATALAALIDADSHVSATATGAVITITNTDTAGSQVEFGGWDVNHLSFKDTTADPGTGIATDLAAIAAEDNDWYGLILDCNAQSQIVAAAAWAETARKLFVYNTSDTGCQDNTVSTDVMSTLKTSAYAYTGGLYIQSRTQTYAAAGWMGNRFPATPGSDTWMYKTLAGVPADSLTDGQIANVETKNGNVYTVLDGVNITQTGVSASGEYFDVTRFVDWQKADIQTRLYSMFLNAPKIPFTDPGIAQVENQIRKSLTLGTRNGGLAEDPAFTITVPKAADISPTDKAARNLTGVSFAAELAGAIHTLTLQGTVTA